MSNICEIHNADKETVENITWEFVQKFGDDTFHSKISPYIQQDVLTLLWACPSPESIWYVNRLAQEVLGFRYEPPPEFIAVNPTQFEKPTKPCDRCLAEYLEETLVQRGERIKYLRKRFHKYSYEWLCLPCLHVLNMAELENNYEYLDEIRI